MRRTTFSFALALLALGTAAALADDASAPASPPPFSAKYLESYRRPGSASIVGTLEVQVSGEDKPVEAARTRVIAVPDSAYTRWWFDTTNAALTAATGTFYDPPDDRKLAPFIKSTYTDEFGNFRFDGLPAGAYRVRGRVDATFDRTVTTTHNVRTIGVDGNMVTAPEVSTDTFHDHSAFWLESGLVRLGRLDSKTIALHVAVRRNILGRR